MTRINVGVNPEELGTGHLMAETREILRIPRAVKRGSFKMEGQPKEFKLGEGHVKFFYDKLLYLKERYMRLYNECKKRGFKVDLNIDAWDGIDEKFMNSYQETEKDRLIILERIEEKKRKKLGL